MSDDKPLNIVLVGDSKVGKSTLISICHIQNPIANENGILTYRLYSEFSTIYTPTLFKSYRTDVRLRGCYSMPYTKKRVFQTNIIDMGGSRRYDGVRPLAYINCDVFLMCFDLTNRASLERVQSKWLPEIRKYEPEAPIILLGNKADLKTERQVMAGKEIHKLSKTLGLDRYIEISCHEHDENVYALFTTAVELAYEYRRMKSELPEEEKEEVIEFDVNELDSLSDPPEFTKKGSTTFCDDWHKMLKDSSLTDIILKFPGGLPDIHVHKFVLSLASGAFKKLLKNTTSCKSLKKEINSCDKCERSSCSCILKGDKLLAGMPIEHEQEGNKIFTNRATSFSCKVDSEKLEITFDASIDHAAITCVTTWMYTGVLDIPEKLDDNNFVENLYHVVLELEIHPLQVLCCYLLKHKAKSGDLRQRTMSSENEMLQVGGIKAPLERYQGNETSDQKDDETQNVTTFPEAPPMELFEILGQESIRKHAQSFETKNGHTVTDHCQHLTEETRAEHAKLDVIIAYKEMWRRADKLLAEDNWLTDTVLVVEDTPISVHRVVMATRSPMLAAMLEGGFKEQDYKQIKLPGVSLEHFHTILEFMYTDKCLLNNANIPGVLEHADRFCIQSLIDRCEEFLLSTFSNYNHATLARHRKEQVGSIMKSIHLSKTYNASFLHKWCLHFVATNYEFFEGRKDFKTVWAENEEFMERNRWPSRRCSQLLKSYKKSRQSKCCIM